MNYERNNKFYKEMRFIYKNDCLSLSEVIPNLLEIDYKRNFELYKECSYRTVCFYYKTVLQISN